MWTRNYGSESVGELKGLLNRNVNYTNRLVINGVEISTCLMVLVGVKVGVALIIGAPTGVGVGVGC